MRVVAHQSFLEQYAEIVQRYPAIKKSLDKQLEKAGASPFTAGEMMRNISHEQLRGKVYKAWVHGQGMPKHKGHRLLFFVHNKDRNDEGTVLPFFISPEPRPEFDYEKFPWQSHAESIYTALVENRQEEFAIFEPWRST